MKCPYCQGEMEKGYLQSGHKILWTQKKHTITLKPQNEKEFILAENPMGGAAIPGFCCRACKKMILEY